MDVLPPRPTKSIIRADEAERWIEGYAFLNGARAAAEALTASTEEVVARARAEGYEAGRKAGEAEAGALLARTTLGVDRYLAELESQLADLTLSIVRQVLGAFNDADLIAASVRQALASFRDERKIVIRVAPDLAGAVEALLQTFDEVDQCFLITSDPHLSRKQCVMTSPIASIDVGLDAQLGAIRTAMTEAKSVSS